MCTIYLFVFRDDQGEDTKETSFHRVFVYDEALRQYIQNNLNTRDRVLVNGRIGHQTYTDADGKKKYSGFIVANEIHKVAKRAASEIKTNEGAELAAENWAERIFETTLINSPQNHQKIFCVFVFSTMVSIDTANPDTLSKTKDLSEWKISSLIFNIISEAIINKKKNIQNKKN